MNEDLKKCVDSEILTIKNGRSKQRVYEACKGIVVAFQRKFPETVDYDRDLRYCVDQIGF